MHYAKDVSDLQPWKPAILRKSCVDSARMQLQAGTAADGKLHQMPSTYRHTIR
jgi:hypothetical protein